MPRVMAVHSIPTARGAARRLAALMVALATFALVATAAAHVPQFPEGEGPFEVEAPTVSKAYYLRLDAGRTHTFRVPPLARTVPLQVLVLDDAIGARLDHVVEIDCDGEADYRSERLDVELFEPFSQIEHRIRVRGTLGPSSAPCLVSVRQTAGPSGPYTFVIGDEERFSAADLFGLVGLGARLDAWREGR